MLFEEKVGRVVYIGLDVDNKIKIFYKLVKVKFFKIYSKTKYRIKYLSNLLMFRNMIMYL